MINHPAATRHPSAEGNLDRDGKGVAAPFAVKGELRPRRDGDSSRHWRGQEVFDFLFGCVIIFRALDDYQCGV